VVAVFLWARIEAAVAAAPDKEIIEWIPNFPF
jgi:hypothetical protein